MHLKIPRYTSIERGTKARHSRKRDLQHKGLISRVYKQLSGQKEKKPRRKVGKRLQQALYQREYPNDQLSCLKMFNLTNNQG